MEENNRVAIVPKRNNYELVINNTPTLLKRDVDFGMITYETKNGEVKNVSNKPCLFKAGAEKILIGLGVPYDTEITDSYKDYATGFFYYEIKATARDNNGNIVRTGVGCANTSEKSNGAALGYDTANSMLKKAKKRAIVDLAISLASASDWFTADLDDTQNENKMKNLQSDEDFITSKQVKRIFAIASSKEITLEKAKSLLASWGYTSTKEIKVKDYDDICEKLENYKEG